MKAFKHVGNTWLLAHFLHPIFFCIYGYVVLKETFDVGAVVSLVAGTVILSLPALLIAVLIFKLIAGLKNFSMKFLLCFWLIIIPAATACNIIFLAALLGDTNMLFKSLHFFIPCLIATTCSVIIRYPAFAISLSQLNNDHEYHSG